MIARSRVIRPTRRSASMGFSWWYEDAEVQHDVPLPESVEVGRHEVVDDRLDAAATQLARDVEARLARQRVPDAEYSVSWYGRGATPSALQRSQ